jgi:SAM-dependent methyltransferase
MHADMRELPFRAEFAGAYSWFTSFGYFSDRENETVIEQIARALAPGGRFLIDMVNRDWILTHPQQRTWNQRDDGALLMEEVALDLHTSRVINRQLLIEGGGGTRVTKAYELRTYTCAELSALFARHGLAVRSVWGGADGSDYSTESRRLVMLAEKA